MDKCLRWVRLQIYRKISPCQTRVTARGRRYPRLLHLTALNQSLDPPSRKGQTTLMTRASPTSKSRRATTPSRFDQEGSPLTANVSQEKMVKNTTITMMVNTTKKNFLRILKTQMICTIWTKTSGKEPRLPPKSQNMIWKVTWTSLINMRRPSNRKSTRSPKPSYTRTSPGWKSTPWPSCSWARQICCLPSSSCITTNCKTSPHTISR